MLTALVSASILIDARINVQFTLKMLVEVSMKTVLRIAIVAVDALMGRSEEDDSSCYKKEEVNCHPLMPIQM